MVWTEHRAQTRSVVTCHTHPLSSWLLHHHCPTLVSGLLGRRQCQSAGSAGLATDLQSTQAVKAT